MTKVLTTTYEPTRSILHVRVGKVGSSEQLHAYIQTPAPNGNILHVQTSTRNTPSVPVYVETFDSTRLDPYTFYIPMYCVVSDPRFKSVSYKKCLVAWSGALGINTKVLTYSLGANPRYLPQLAFQSMETLQDTVVVTAPFSDSLPKKLANVGVTVESPEESSVWVIGVSIPSAIRACTLGRFGVLSGGLQRVLTKIGASPVGSLIVSAKRVGVTVTSAVTATFRSVAFGIFDPIRKMIRSITFATSSSELTQTHTVSVNSAKATLTERISLTTLVTRAVHTAYARVSSHIVQPVVVRLATLSASVVAPIKKHISFVSAAVRKPIHTYYARLSANPDGFLQVKTLFIRVFGLQILGKGLATVSASLYRIAERIGNVVASIQQGINRAVMTLHSYRVSSERNLVGHTYYAYAKRTAAITYNAMNVPHRIEIWFQAMAVKKTYPMTFAALCPVTRVVIGCSVLRTDIESMLFATVGSVKDTSVLSMTVMRVATRTLLKMLALGEASSIMYSSEITFSLKDSDIPVIPPVPAFPEEDWKGGYVSDPFKGAEPRPTDNANGYVSPDVDRWVQNFNAYWRRAPKPFTNN